MRVISTLFPPRYDVIRLIGGKFRGIAADIGAFVSIAMFRGGRRQVSRGADSKDQISTTLSQISVVDDLHEESGLITQQIIMNSMSLAHDLV